MLNVLFLMLSDASNRKIKKHKEKIPYDKNLEYPLKNLNIIRLN